MAKPCEYDTCACGRRKHKSSLRCLRCHHRRGRITREARKWALAVYHHEPLIMVLSEKALARLKAGKGSYVKAIQD
jgi:hypothetical protein